MTDIRLKEGDIQDLADIICGITVIGAYSASAGLENDAERLNILRRRIILENRELAERLVESEPVTTTQDPDSFREGIKEILEE